VNWPTDLTGWQSPIEVPPPHLTPLVVQVILALAGPRMSPKDSDIRIGIYDAHSGVWGVSDCDVGIPDEEGVVILWQFAPRAKKWKERPDVPRDIRSKRPVDKYVRRPRAQRGRG